MKRKFHLLGATALLICTVMIGCKKKEIVTTPIVIKTINLKVNFSQNSTFTLFRFSDSSVVENSDSATNKWDFGMRQATIIVNSNVSGPGNAGVILQDALYSNVQTAPVSGYAYDTSANHLAISNFTKWASYDVQTHSFIPTAGKTFVFKTADGQHYAKMEILGIEYEPFIGQVPLHLIYHFRYTYQPNATSNF